MFFICDGLFVDWIFAAKLGDTGTDFIRFVFKVGSSQLDEVSDLDHILFLEASGGDSRSADTQTAGDEWALWVVRDCVLVGGDINLVQTFLQLFAGDVHVLQVDEDQMVIGAAGYQAEA